MSAPPLRQVRIEILPGSSNEETREAVKEAANLHGLDVDAMGVSWIPVFRTSAFAVAQRRSPKLWRSHRSADPAGDPNLAHWSPRRLKEIDL